MNDSAESFRLPTRRQFLSRSCIALGAAVLPSVAIAATADKPVEIPNIPQPGYLESYRDPVFGTRVTRITGDPGTLIPNIDARWDAVARHLYPKTAAWNCDQSLLHLARHHGFPSALFLDGANYRPLFGRNNSPGTEVRWHPKQPANMIYVKGNEIGVWDVRADTSRVIAAFPGYSDFHIGPWEGNLSADGRMLVVIGKQGEDRIAFAYDLEAKKKRLDLVLKGIEVDWVSISSSGKLIVLNGKFTAANGDQTQIYDLDGNKVGDLWEEYGRPSHCDLAIDENGDDIAVGVSKSKPDDGRVIKRRLRDGKITVLTSGGYASHTSTRNVDLPGWAFATYQYRGPDWPPYRDEVVAVKLDGSMTVKRIAHLHTHTTDYLTEAHAVPSPDGKRVLWASDWEAPTGRPIGAYVADW